jgi:hypothetical protein
MTLLFADWNSFRFILIFLYTLKRTLTWLWQGLLGNTEIRGMTQVQLPGGLLPDRQEE